MKRSQRALVVLTAVYLGATLATGVLTLLGVMRTETVAWVLLLIQVVAGAAALRMAWKLASGKTEADKVVRFFNRTTGRRVQNLTVRYKAVGDVQWQAYTGSPHLPTTIGPGQPAEDHASFLYIDQNVVEWKVTFDVVDHAPGMPGDGGNPTHTDSTLACPTLTPPPRNPNLYDLQIDLSTSSGGADQQMITVRCWEDRQQGRREFSHLY